MSDTSVEFPAKRVGMVLGRVVCRRLVVSCDLVVGYFLVMPRRLGFTGKFRVMLSDVEIGSFLSLSRLCFGGIR